MRATCSASTTKSIILKDMEISYQSRRFFINDKNPTITEIINKYPKILDFAGDLIKQEFILLAVGKNNDLFSIFPMMTKKINQLDVLYKGQLECK